MSLVRGNKPTPDTPAYAVSRDQLQALTDLRALAYRELPVARAAGNQQAVDLCLDVIARLKGLVR